ncbi:MAG TPA: hypothetical protein VN915_09945 [Elusimicrobiota bacterium]|nr:hypothetical protein [Elusimicrobiota bacterium]
MRALCLAVLLLVPAPSRAQTPAAPAADWRKADVSGPMQDALRNAGYGLQDDGRVLDPKSHQPLTGAQLNDALQRIDLTARRLALERLRLVLAHDPMTDADRAAAAALKENLPDDVAKALDADAGLAGLRELTDRDLTAVAAYFDGTRTAAERAEAATPVVAGPPGPRAPLPYFDASEQRLGDALRGAAARRLGTDPVGREILARLNGPDGRPDLPPVVVEPLSGGDAARYDYRRRALVLSPDALISAATGLAPSKDRGALEKSLASRPALIAYLNAHPSAVAAAAAQNDVLLAHELTHAWQDRRDPVMQEMSRGTLPAAVVIDFEEEAWLTKNRYLGSKLVHDPASVSDDAELDDYRNMTAAPTLWLLRLRDNYAAAASNAMDLSETAEIQNHRLEMARARAVTSSAEQQAKALDLAALGRADKELAAASEDEHQRVGALHVAAVRGETASAAALAGYYLQSALAADNSADYAVRIGNAESYAVKSGDAALLAKVRAVKESRK